MDRSVSLELLIKTFSFIVLILSLCSVNIYIYVRHRRSFLTVCLHIISLFVLSGLFCLIIDTVILDLRFESIFRTAMYVSFILCVIFIVAGITAITMKSRKNGLYFGLPPNLEAVFFSADALSLVADYRGIITQVNHPEKLDALCRRQTNLMDIFSELKESLGAAWPFPEDISEITESIQCQAAFHEGTKYYLLRVSPIISGGAGVGFTVLFEDISTIRQSEIKLKEQNALLTQANEKLDHFVKIAGALEAQKERLEILEQIQATLIEKIEKAISCVCNIQNTGFENETYQHDIREIANLLRKVYSDVRTSVSRIAGKDALPI